VFHEADRFDVRLARRAEPVHDRPGRAAACVQSANLGDFNKLASNFGLSAAGPTVTPGDWARLGAAVPEPTGIGALLLGSAALLGGRRRSRRRGR